MTRQEAFYWSVLLLNFVMLFWNLATGSWFFLLSVLGVGLMVYALTSHYQDKY